MTNKYAPYDTSELDILMNEPWEVSDRPYMLHAAFALDSLYDLVTPEEDEKSSRANMWGCRIEKKILDRLVLDIADDFNDAAANYKLIRILGKNYSVRRPNAYDRKRLPLIFNFPMKNGEYIISKEGVLNLAGLSNTSLKIYEVTKEQAKINRSYLRQIIKLAEDDKNDGWDKLTDMEIIVYCWALFYNKYQSDNFVLFKKEYKDYLYASESDILDCLNEKSTLRQSPVGMYAFSHDKVIEWNKANKQESFADKISINEAEDYWYEIALKKTFKPIDQR